MAFSTFAVRTLSTQLSESSPNALMSPLILVLLIRMFFTPSNPFTLHWATSCSPYSPVIGFTSETSFTNAPLVSSLALIHSPRIPELVLYNIMVEDSYIYRYKLAYYFLFLVSCYFHTSPCVCFGHCNTCRTLRHPHKESYSGCNR